jgi:hypothetical protein
MRLYFTMLRRYGLSENNGEPGLEAHTCAEDSERSIALFCGSIKGYLWKAGIEATKIGFSINLGKYLEQGKKNDVYGNVPSWLPVSASRSLGLCPSGFQYRSPA